MSYTPPTATMPIAREQEKEKKTQLNLIIYSDRRDYNNEENNQ